ncbi:MAG: twin-arginine translocase subunit TatC [Bacteroidales bacterium]|nr:twin-arginine translocase subunit TatC [Bacteroidales bacterium]
MTFWDHLDELRNRLWRMLAVAAVGMVACFCFKRQLFAIVFAPKPEAMHLINTDLAQPLLVHMQLALWAGLLLASPYLLYQLFAFIAPGLYRAERRAVAMAIATAYLLFALGVLLNYFVLFPFTVRFLYSYDIGTEVANTITLTNYLALLGTMSLIIGLVFELPVLCWLLARLGLLSAATMRRFRRHALVVILILAAVITPTADPFTLALASLPIYLLWELSILVVKRTAKADRNQPLNPIAS